jgi:AcrR family transcriptional regulator
MGASGSNTNTTKKRGARGKAKAKAQSSVSSKTAILHAAELLFATEGFRDATLQDIARASGVNSALVAYYYGSKSGLLRAVIEDKLEKVDQMMGMLASDATVTRDDLRRTISGILEGIRTDETFHRIGSRILVEDEEMRNVLVQSLWQKVFDFITMMIDKIQEGKIPRDEMEIRTLMVCGLFHQYANLKNFTLGAYKLSQTPEQTLANYESYLSGEIVDTICSASSWASGRRGARK